MARFPRAVFASVLLAAAAVACSGPSRSVIRVVSTPPGAGFFVPRLGLQGQMPYDFAGLSPDDRIVIGLEGYKEWIGRVGDLRQVADGTYHAELTPER